MRYACAAATERRADALATIVKKMMRNRCGKCINTLERQHVNRRVLIRKRLREHVKSSTSCLAPTAQYHCEPGAARPRASRSRKRLSAEGATHSGGLESRLHRWDLG